jgi:hypothetical protein
MARTLPYLIIGIGILFLCACPAQAFTAKTLDINVQDNGDAVITFTYSLSWFENAAVFAHIADPNTQLKNALESNYGKNVDVMAATGNQAEVLVHGFATRTMTDNGVTLTTPELSFESAQRVLNHYWFAPLITVDFSPDVTAVDFPDGYVENYYDQITIPAISHTLNG